MNPKHCKLSISTKGKLASTLPIKDKKSLMKRQPQDSGDSGDNDNIIRRFVSSSKIKLRMKDETYTLLTDTDYVVGRKDADIMVLNDASISRRHALFKVNHPEANIPHPHKPPSLVLQDMSKLGSKIEGECFKGVSKPVLSGNVVTFGTQGISKYRALYEPMVLTTSCIAGPFKKAVKTLVLKLGGHTVSEWRKECQMLVMSNLSVTVKVICALVSLKPIVTPQYLQNLITSIENKSPRPSKDDYLPPLAESQLDPSLVSFKPEKIRQTLFQGKIFIFLSTKQFKKLNIVIELAGGTPMLMEEGTDNNEDDILISPATCVMSCDQTEATQMSQNAQQWINHVMQFLARNKKRAISDPEIGYAILYCSTKKYCNPDSKMDDAPTGQVPIVPQSLSQAPPVQMSEQQHEVLVHNTELDNTVNRTRHASRGKISKIDETRIEDQLKKEPVNLSNTESQQVTDLLSSSVSKKRPREKESLSTEPEIKRIAPDRHIKQEPITPQKAIITDFTASPAKSTRSKSRSPSPAPKTRASKHPDVKPETVDFDDFDFDSIPVKKSRRRAVRNEDNDEIEPVTNTVTVKKEATATSVSSCTITKTEPVNLDTKKSASDDLPDDFDEFPVRRRRTNRNRSGNKTSNSDSKETEGINKKQPMPVQESEQAETVDSRDSIMRDSEKELVYEREGKDSSGTSRKPSSKNASQKETRVKKQIKEEIDDLLDSNVPSVTERSYSHSDGFLSAKRAVEGEFRKISEFSAKQEDMPSKCANIEEKSLITRKPGQNMAKSKTTGGACMWKGKRVKNFKKFRKVGHLGLEGLPRIIGGSDLIVHEAKPREELEEWFREEMQTESMLVFENQVESQNNEIEKLAKEMFEWEPRMKKRRP